MSDQVYDPRTVHTFNYTHEKPTGIDNEYNVPWGTPVPPIQGYGNVTYSQLMSVIGKIWEKAHPEVKFVPLGSREKFDPEIGYIVYSLENKKPADSNLKPKFRTDIVNTDSGDKEGAVFSQSFDHLVQFTAVHINPYTAEELIETFEDFMMVVTPQLIQVGVEKIFYNRRVADRDETRFGQDVSSRAVQYLAQLQKLILINVEILEHVRIDVRLMMESATPDTYSIMYADVPYPPPV